MDKLLLISNLTHEDRGEDLLLADRLSVEFDVTIASPTTAVPLLAAGIVDGCMIRNAWPCRFFTGEFASIEKLLDYHKVPCYNPFVPNRRGPVEDKRYLAELYESGYPVIPTYRSISDMTQAGYSLEQRILSKPLNGCSSDGIVDSALQKAVAGNWVFQPWIDFEFEVSFYFIDNFYAWAMRSAGNTAKHRWQLERYRPSADELSWARRFVDWNGFPYGIQRIDAARMLDGSLLLMEVEDSTPFLSLEALSIEARDAVLAALIESAKQHLGTESARNLASRRFARPIEKMVEKIEHED